MYLIVIILYIFLLIAFSSVYQVSSTSKVVMSSIWRRPANLEHPQIWHTFKAKDIDSDKLVEYRVQDLPFDRYRDAIDHISGDFLKDEPFCLSKDILGNADSLEDIRRLWRKLLAQNTVLVCFKEGSDEIAGLNMVGVVVKDDSDEKPKVSENFCQLSNAE